MLFYIRLVRNRWFWSSMLGCTVCFFKRLWMVCTCIKIAFLISGFSVKSCLKNIVFVFIYHSVQKWEYGYVKYCVQIWSCYFFYLNFLKIQVVLWSKEKSLLFPKMRMTRKIFTRTAAKLFFNRFSADILFSSLVFFLFLFLLFLFVCSLFFWIWKCIFWYKFDCAGEWVIKIFSPGQGYFSFGLTVRIMNISSIYRKHSIDLFLMQEYIFILFLKLCHKNICSCWSKDCTHCTSHYL